MGAPVGNARVITLAIDEASAAVPGAPGDGPFLLILSYRGTVVGEIFVPENGGSSREGLLRRLPPEIRDRVATRRLGTDFARATRGACPPDKPAVPAPPVTVVVTTRDRPDSLRLCLGNVFAQGGEIGEVVVADCSVDARPAQAVCRDYSVRHLAEPGAGLARARNRGLAEATSDLVAFVEDDCMLEAGWFQGIEEPFGDPLLAAVTGYVGPLVLHRREQWLFDAREAPGRRYELRRLGGLGASSYDIRYRSAVFRRSALREVGLFAEDLPAASSMGAGLDTELTYRLFRSGYSILIDPSRIAWHRHPADAAALERSLAADLVGRLAVASRCATEHRDLLASLAVFRSAIGGFTAAMRCLGERADVDRRRIVGGALRQARRKAPRLPSPLSEGYARVPSPSPAASRAPSAVVRTPEAPPLSVVVPSYNRRALLGDVLLALARQEYSPTHFEVVVVLDGSTDGSAEFVRALDTPYELRLVEQANRGLAAARNTGVREAREDLFVFLDDDLVPEPQFIAAHAHAHGRDQHEVVVLGSCPPVAHGSGLWPVYFRSIWDVHYRSKSQAHHRWTFADVVGGNCSLPRSLIVDTGGWDERFSRREDWELGVRLLSRDTSFSYEPSALAWHRSQSSLQVELRNRRTEARDDVYFAGKHPHVKPQLPLATYARVIRSRKGSLAFRYRRVGDRTSKAAVALTDVLEALRLRRQWVELVDLLLAHAYFLGLAEALPVRDDLSQFLGPVVRGEHVQTLDVVLGEEGCLQVPGDAGAIDLLVRYPHTPPVRVRALEPEGQWDWAALEERLLRAESPQLARDIPEGQLR